MTNRYVERVAGDGDETLKVEIGGILTNQPEELAPVDTSRLRIPHRVGSKRSKQVRAHGKEVSDRMTAKACAKADRTTSRRNERRAARAERREQRNARTA